MNWGPLGVFTGTPLGGSAWHSLCPRAVTGTNAEQLAQPFNVDPARGSRRAARFVEVAVVLGELLLLGQDVWP